MAYLLLLPGPPTVLSLSSFRAAYGPGLASVLSSVRRSHASVSLDICLACQEASSINDLTRNVSFMYFQRLLSRLYSLAASILAEDSLTLDEEKLNIRVYLLDVGLQSETDKSSHYQGTIISLKALSTASRKWTDVFGLDGEAGEALLQAFIKERKSQPSARNSDFGIHRVPGGTVIVSRDTNVLKSSDGQDKRDQHRSIAVGGTFDHLHLGHKLLLTATALALDPARISSNESRVLTIGITTTALLKDKAYATVMQSWTARERSVITFVASILDLDVSSPSELQCQTFSKDEKHGTAIHYEFASGLTVRCVEIDDPFGPTITDEDIDTLVVSAETRKGGAAVNQKRAEKGWRELEVFEVDVIDAIPSDDSEDISQDFKSKISSTEIRKRIAETTQQSEA